MCGHVTRLFWCFFFSGFLYHYYFDTMKALALLEGECYRFGSTTSRIQFIWRMVEEDEQHVGLYVPSQVLGKYTHSLSF